MHFKHVPTLPYKIFDFLVRLNFGDFYKYCPVSTTRDHPYDLYVTLSVVEF